MNGVLFITEPDYAIYLRSIVLPVTIAVQIGSYLGPITYSLWRASLLYGGHLCYMARRRRRFGDSDRHTVAYNMPPRSYIEAMDRPTVLYIIYTMVSAQQTNLLPKNASRNDAIFAQKVYRIYATTSQYLSSYRCAITMVYLSIYIISIYIIYN